MKIKSAPFLSNLSFQIQQEIFICFLDRMIRFNIVVVIVVVVGGSMIRMTNTFDDEAAQGFCFILSVFKLQLDEEEFI